MGKFDSIKTSIGRGLSLAKGKTVAYSPEIMVIVGAAASIGAAVFAAKRTDRFKVVLDAYREDKKGIAEALELAQNDDEAKVEYTEVQARQDMISSVADLCSGFLKVYWPAITLEAVAIACNIASVSIMRKRVTAISAAYASSVAAFAAYRQRVVDKFGEAADRSLMYGDESVELVTEVQNEDGSKSVKAEEHIDITGKDVETNIIRFFPNSSVYGGAGAAYGDLFGRGIEHYANLELEIKGYMFLNDLHKELGQYEKLTNQELVAGQSLGWVYDKTKPFDAQFKVKTQKAVQNGEKGLLVEFPQPVNLLSYLRNGHCELNKGV